MKLIRIHILFLVSILANGCGALEWKDKLLTAASNQIPWSFENAMGDQLLPSVLPAEDAITDPRLIADLEALLAPITSKVDQPQIKIHISRDPELNAFAIPGGHLIFNKGMLLAAETPEEIVGVAAHEIAHATERHVMRSMIQGLSVYAVITLFFGDLSGIGAYLLAQGQQLLATGFSRKQERAADEKGLDKLIASGIDPRGMVRFFERLQKESGSSGASAGITKFYSTHPLTQERIETIEARIKALPSGEQRWSPVSFNLKDFQSRL